MKIAILDDYQGCALDYADWSSIPGSPEIVVFRDTLKDPVALVARLRPFDVLCVMRERTPLTGEILHQLPHLRLIASTGAANASIDRKAASDLGIEIRHTAYESAPAVELTWALLMALAKNIVRENTSLRKGGWQTSIGTDLRGKTLGLLGLGRIGTRIAEIARAFEMPVIAWSPNLTKERAEAAGARLVSRESLFRQADFLSVHLVLSEKTRGVVGKTELQMLKSNAFFINTSRGALVDEVALLKILHEKKIAGAALDAFEREPLPVEHPFRRTENLLITPHIGFVSDSLYRTFYGDSVENIRSWAADPSRKI